MAFDAEQRKMNDILSGDFKYIIPRYQRKYVWQEKQWRELFDDIKYCLDAATTQDDAGVEWTHFLGSFVFERQGKDLIGNAQDRPFAEKLSFYERSNFISTKKFINRNKNIDEWENDQIEKRGKYMAKLAYNEIWKFES